MRRITAVDRALAGTWGIVRAVEISSSNGLSMFTAIGSIHSIQRTAPIHVFAMRFFKVSAPNPRTRTAITPETQSSVCSFS